MLRKKLSSLHYQHRVVLPVCRLVIASGGSLNVIWMWFWHSLRHGSSLTYDLLTCNTRRVVTFMTSSWIIRHFALNISSYFHLQRSRHMMCRRLIPYTPASFKFNVLDLTSSNSQRSMVLFSYHSAPPVWVTHISKLHILLWNVYGKFKHKRTDQCFHKGDRLPRISLVNPCTKPFFDE